jgi:hypothetical protein
MSSLIFLVLGLALAAVAVSLGFVFVGKYFLAGSEKKKFPFFLEILLFISCLLVAFVKFYLGKRSEDEEQLERIVDYSHCVLGALFVLIVYPPIVEQSKIGKPLGIVGSFLIPVAVLAIEIFVSPNLWEQYE